MNPGTINNNERTYDRDLYFSDLLRKPHHPSGYLRSCDFDPTIICNKCALPVIMLEATRIEGKKATRYIEAMAKKIGITAYLVRHNGNLNLPATTIAIEDPVKRKKCTLVQEGINTKIVTSSFSQSINNWREESINTVENKDPASLFKEWLEGKFKKHYESCQ